MAFAVQGINGQAFAGKGIDFDVNAMVWTDEGLKIRAEAIGLNIEWSGIIKNVTIKQARVTKPITADSMATRCAKMQARGWILT